MNLDQTFNNLVEKLQGWLDSLILALPNLVVAVLVVIGFAFAARIVRRLVQRGMDRVSSYKQVNKLLGTTGYLIVLAAGVFIALGILDLDKTVTSLLAGAGIIGLALGFAFQDIATNFSKQTDFLHAQSEAIMRLKQAFDDNDITIPFPIRTLDFGVVGGEKLNEVLPPSLYEPSPRRTATDGPPLGA